MFHGGKIGDMKSARGREILLGDSFGNPKLTDAQAEAFSDVEVRQLLVSDGDTSPTHY